MQKTLRRLGPCVAVALLVGGPVMAAPSAHPGVAVQAAATKPGQVQGELVRVDVRAKTITMRESNGAVMKFRYTDKTEITGAEKDAAGLATDKGHHIVVHYEIDKQHDGRTLSFVATWIEVRPAKS